MTSAMLSSDILYNQLIASMTGKSLLLGSSEFHPCCKCGATFGDSKSLTKHELSHQKRKHECKECGKRFNSSSDLKRHSLIHTNTRPYKCHLCPTAFVQQAHLTRHLKSHTRHGVRFKCLGCGTMFLHSTNVRWHQQFCEQAQGTNGGYVVTQSEGEGIDNSTTSTIKAAETKNSKPLWARDNKVHYFGGKDRRHSSSSSEAETTSSTGSTDSEPGSNSFLNTNKMLLFDGSADQSSLWSRTKLENDLKKQSQTNLTTSQLSYLNSRVSMVGPKQLKTQATLPSVPQPAQTDDLLKLLAAMQDGKNAKTGTVSPNEAALKAPNSHSSCYNLQATSPSSSYKIVPNKIIQHNVTSHSNPVTSSENFMTSSTSVSSAPSGPIGSFTGHLTGKTGDDKIKPIIDLVKKLVAEGLQSPAADIILNAISRHLGNVPQTQSKGASLIPPTTSLPPLKKRKLSEPAHERLQNNLMTSQNLLVNNLFPLLQKGDSSPSLLTTANQTTPSTSLSFTPLMFRQFPRIGNLPAQSSLFTSSSFKPTSSFASQLFQLATKTPTTTLPVTKEVDVTLQTAASITTGELNTTEVRKPLESTSEISPLPIKVENASLCETSQPIVKREMTSRASEEPMEGECAGLAVPESSPAGPGQDTPELMKGIEASKNIAFHRLTDLLSFV